MKRAILLLALVQLLFGCGDYSERASALRSKADSGDPQALLELGWAYSFGDEDLNPAEEAKPYIIPGIHKDLAMARKLIELSARKGNPRAMLITSTNDLFDHDYTGAVYWAWKAGNIDRQYSSTFQQLVTLSKTEPSGAFTAEQRQAILNALNLDATTIEAAMGNPMQASTSTSEATAVVPAQDPALEAAKANSFTYLCKMCAGGNRNFFTVTESSAFYNDHERDNTSYPITVMLEVRFSNGYSMIRRDASFACDGAGNVIQPLQLPSAGPE
jgi:TPR repeat protein